MALTKIGKEGITGVSNSADATFLTATSGEGVTLAGTLAVTGVHTVGTNAVATSEGGAVTTNILQGLAKSWCHIDGDGTASILDSFNGTSMTDHGTGDYTFTIANDFLSAARRNCAMGCWNSDDRTQSIATATRGMQIYQSVGAEAAGTFRVNVQYGASGTANGALYDSGSVYLTFHGDLA